jgi:hypothetical protein
MGVSLTSRQKFKERRKEVSKRINEMRSKIVAEQVEQENRRFEAGKITIDKFGMISKKVHYDYDDED